MDVLTSRSDMYALREESNVTTETEIGMMQSRSQGFLTNARKGKTGFSFIGFRGSIALKHFGLGLLFSSM